MLFETSMTTYAITTVTWERRALFLRTANAELLLDTLFRYRDQGRYLLHGFAIMPEHIHVLLTPSANHTIERCAQYIKGGFSHRIRGQFRGEVWQPGFHDHRVRDGSDFKKQIEYIAANPERRGLANHLYVHTNFLDRLDVAPYLGI
jgi:putative transposase